MDIVGNVRINGPEINTQVTRRIATLIGYEMTDEEIANTIPVTTATPARWVRFMTREIRAGRYEVA